MEFWRRKMVKSKARKRFLRNGSLFLRKLIADCNGISNPIRMFSPDQISKATDHFNPKCRVPFTSPCYTWYKGAIEGRSSAIKIHKDAEEEMSYNDIALSARVSNHSGFPKLIGCCLELPLPVSVFEDLGYRVLNERGTVGCEEDAPLLPWNVRLKIAKEVAIAITYLHTAFPRIIIHRDILSTNVLLDKNGTAKLTNFSCAVTLPEGKSWILEDRVIGTLGYIDPDYYTTGLVTEYTDVFSFGILMLILLIGRPGIFLGSDAKCDNSTNIVKYVKDLQKRGEPVEFGGDSNDMNLVQMKMFLDLALRCCDWRSVDKPKMIVVAKEIKLI
ncbi:hypothetical protein Bca4012_021670 [Brassica carinata]